MELSHQSDQQSERRPLLGSNKKKPNSSDHPVIPQAEMPKLGSSIARPISLLDLDIKGKQFYLSQAAKKHLESLEGECYVISVSGNPLVGKSSLLNLLLSLFKKDDSQEKISYQDMYPVGDGKRRMTDGIDMFCLSKNGKNFIFLDVEGDNDPIRKKTGVWIYSNLIQTAVGMSHLHLHKYNGIPQESFCSYFETISPIVRQNNLHADFQTKYAFFRRNCSFSQKISPEEFEEFKSPIDERLSQSGMDYSLHLLPMPPNHITEKKSETSCIGSKGFLCEECQSHEFTTILLDLNHELSDHMRRMAPFENGHQVVKVVEQLMEINKREIEFFLDNGHLSKIRLERIRKERLRIQDYLLDVEKCQGGRGLSKDIQKILTDHPKLAPENVGQDFYNTQNSLTEIVSKMEFLIPELFQFIEQYLLDERASILNEEEKDALHETYVARFGELAEKVINSLEAYDALIESFSNTLVEMNDGIKKNIQEYVDAVDGAVIKSLATALEVGASGALAFVGKEVATKVVAGVLVEEDSL